MFHNFSKLIYTRIYIFGFNHLKIFTVIIIRSYFQIQTKRQQVQRQRCSFPRRKDRCGVYQGLL